MNSQPKPNKPAKHIDEDSQIPKIKTQRPMKIQQDQSEYTIESTNDNDHAVNIKMKLQDKLQELYEDNKEMNQFLDKQLANMNIDQEFSGLKDFMNAGGPSIEKSDSFLKTMDDWVSSAMKLGPKNDDQSNK